MAARWADRKALCLLVPISFSGSATGVLLQAAHPHASSPLDLSFWLVGSEPLWPATWLLWWTSVGWWLWGVGLLLMTGWWTILSESWWCCTVKLTMSGYMPGLYPGPRKDHMSMRSLLSTQESVRVRRPQSHPLFIVYPPGPGRCGLHPFIPQRAVLTLISLLRDGKCIPFACQSQDLLLLLFSSVTSVETPSLNRLSMT